MKKKENKFFYVVGIILTITFLSHEAFAAEKSLTLKDLKNLEYTINGEKIKLNNDQYKSRSSTANVVSASIGKYSFGDMNGDGLKDAAVIIEWSGGGSHGFRKLNIVINKNGRPVFLTSISSETVVVNSLEINSGIITVTGLIYGPDNPQCCPSQKNTEKFRLSKNKLIKM
jgi:hypothetical protein